MLTKMLRQSCNRVFVLLLLCLVALSGAFQCPQGPGCSDCEVLPNGEHEIICRNSPADSTFQIKYKPNAYILIKCHHSSNWRNFHLGRTMKVQHIDAIYFRTCELPENDQLSAIVRQLVDENIEELDFQSYNNLTTTLSRSSLKDFHEVKKLTLSSNGLANVTEDLFNDLPNLRVLNLQENDLRELPENFLNLPNLRAIELSSNKLEIIEPWAFEKLEQLKLLNLWNNKLIEIKPHSFDKLTELMSIDLQNNRLTTLPEHIFALLPNIKSINLSKNNFSENSLPDDLFRHNSDLEEIKLFDNKQNVTTLPNKFFGNLTKLTTLILRRNGFLHLPEDLFWGSASLTNLNIERNYLETLPLQFFRDCKNLTALDLSFNNIEFLPDGIFAPLRKLTSLDLSKNRISTVTAHLLTGMSSLSTLNMERNNMIFIDKYALQGLRSLRVAIFSYNQLTLKSSGHAIQTEFGFLSPFEAVQSSIEKLYLAHNNISAIFSDWTFATHLHKLDLSYNKFKIINTEDLYFLSSDIDVDLSSNDIETIVVMNNAYYKQATPRNVIINFANNPIKCDCMIYNVLLYQEGRLHPAVNNLFNLRTRSLKCTGPVPYHNITVSHLESKSFVCAIDSYYNKPCPSPCDCGIKPSTKALLINCAGKGLLKPPTSLDFPTHMDNLHIELNLSDNYLSRMPTMSEKGYDKVTVLSLAENNIQDISVEELSENLEILHLESNNLTRLNADTLDFLTNATKLKSLTLDDNDWICDCDTRDFFRFIQTKRVDMPELQKVTCRSWTKPVYEMTPDELCPLMLEWIIGGCIVVALLGVAIGCIAAMYYRYQHEIKVWLYAHQWCLSLITENELDKDKLYDAFISYSHKDDDFVVHNLVSKLEDGPNPFKLCVHYRDWLAGEWIPTQIAKSVDESRRTIVVLSPNFLESVWGRMEFRAAHKQALSEGRARLIVILYGDIGPTESLDPELKSYLSMNTYVKWGDPWFWEKLRYALPHSIDLTKKKHKKRSVFQTHQPTIQTGNEKCELIESSDATRTPPETSTPPYNTMKTVITTENDINRNSLNAALTKELTATIREPKSVILASIDEDVKSDVPSVRPQWTNV